MKEECLICRAPLEYFGEDILMECEFCHKSFSSKTRCTNGHYVCDDCHIRGIDRIFTICRAEKSRNPVAILEKLMSQPFCHMHGPEHHVMVGASLLTAYFNAGGDIDLDKALKEMYQRGKAVPGGVCGFWGACGAGISTGMYISIVTGSTPLAKESWGLSNRMTSFSLGKIGEIGGPRCCKRDSYLALKAAIEFTKYELGTELEQQDIVCTRSAANNQCIKNRCPFYREEV